MKRRAAFFALPFLAAAAFAQSADLKDLSQAQGEARAALSAARTARVALTCQDAAAHPYNGVAGTLDFRTMAFAVEGGSASAPLDARKGASLVDERCGTAAADFAASLNYDVTGRHKWGQDILQLPKAAIPRAGTATFTANLHTCSYDGDWSMSDNVAVTCTAKVQ